MKCQEAEEWMQRYLDHELNEEDSSLLFEHIGGCKACAEAFEQLSDLFARLEMLPQVTPNFSLVDAILPQLEEIDRARLEEGSTAETSTLPMMMVDREASGKAAGATIGQDERRRSGGRALQRSWTYRYGALGAAAVLILGVFIYQYEPRTVSDAEMSVAYQQNQGLNGPYSGSESAADEANEETSPQLESDAGSADNKLSPEVPDQTAKAPVLDKSTPSDAGPVKEDISEQQPVNPPQAIQPGTRSGGNTALDQRQADSSGNPPVGSQGNADQAQPEAQKSLRSGTFMDTGEETDSADMNQQFTQQEADDKAIADMADGYSLSGEPLAWSSADGAFEAEVRDGYLYIYQWESEERKQVHVLQLDGEWVTGGWSAEDHVFMYQTMKEGTAISHKFEVGQLAEKKAEGE